MASRKSVGSILKPAKVRAPLKQIEVVDQDDDENTATSIKRKVSFSGMNKIKMYNTGATSLTVHQAPMFDEQISVMSDNSNTEKPILSEKLEKSDGQMTFESTNCTNVEDNVRVVIEYESPNDNMEMTEALSGKFFSDTIYTIDNNGSEYIDYKSDYSDSNMEITEAIHVGQVITAEIESDFSSTEMTQTLNYKDNELQIPFENISYSKQLETQSVHINDDANSLRLINEDSQKSKEIDDLLGNVGYYNQEATEHTNSSHNGVYKSTSVPNQKMSLSGTNKINMYNTRKSLTINQIPKLDEKILVFSVSSCGKETKLAEEFEKSNNQYQETSICTNVESDVHVINDCSFNNMEMTEVLSGKILSNKMYTTTDNTSFEQISSNSDYSDSNMEITKTIKGNQDIFSDIESDLNSSKTSETLNDEDKQLKIKSKEIYNFSVNNEANSLNLVDVKLFEQKLNISNKSLINKIHSNHEANDISTNEVNDNDSLSKLHDNSIIQNLNESGESLSNKRQKTNEININSIYKNGIYNYTASLSKRKMSISGMNKIKTFNTSSTSLAAIHQTSMIDEKTSVLSDSTNNEKIKLSGEYEKCDNQMTAKSDPILNEHNYNSIANNSDYSEIEIELTETVYAGKIIIDDNEQLETQSEKTSISLVNNDVNSLSLNKLNESDLSQTNDKYFYQETNEMNTNNVYDKELSFMEVDSPIKKFNESGKLLRSNEIEKKELIETIQVSLNVDNESYLNSTEKSIILNVEDEELEPQSEETSNNDVKSLSLNKLNESGQSLNNDKYFYQEANEIHTNNVYNKELSLMDVDSPTKNFNESGKFLGSNEIEKKELIETIQVSINVDNESYLNSTEKSITLNVEDEELEPQSEETSNNDVKSLSLNKLNESGQSLNNDKYFYQEANEIHTNNVYNKELSLMDVDSPTKNFNESGKFLGSNEIEKKELIETIQVSINVDNESYLNSTEKSITLNVEDEELTTQSEETSNNDVKSLSLNKLNESGQSLTNDKYIYQEANEIHTNNVYNKELSLTDVDSPTKNFNENGEFFGTNEIEKKESTETIQVGITVDNESYLNSTEKSITLNVEDEELTTQSEETSNNDVKSLSLNKLNESGQSLNNDKYFYQEVNEINTNNVYNKELSLMDVDSPTKNFNESGKFLGSNEIEKKELTETIQVGITVDNESYLNSTEKFKTLNFDDEELETQSEDISNSLVNNDVNSLNFNELNERDQSLSNEIYIDHEVNEFKTNNGHDCIYEMAKEKTIIIPNEFEENEKQIDNQTHGNEMLKYNKGKNRSNNVSIQITDNIGKTISSNDNSSEYSINKITNDISIEDISNMSISDKVIQKDEKLFIGNRKRSYSNRKYVPLSCSSFISNSKIQNNAVGESPIRKKVTKEDSINKEYVIENVEMDVSGKEQSVKEYLCNEVLEFLTRWNEQFVEKILVLNKCTNSEWIFNILDNNIILTILYSPIFNDNSFLKVDDISFKTHNKTQNHSINFGINWILSKYNSKVYKQICFTSRDVELLLKSLLDDVQFISKVINNIMFVKDVYCVTVKDDKAQFILHDMNDKNGPLMVRIEVSLINIHKLSIKHITTDVLFGFFNTNILNEIIENVTKDCNVLQSLIENLKNSLKR